MAKSEWSDQESGALGAIDERSWGKATSDEVMLLQAGQSRCPVCNGPFEYWPNRQEVVLRNDDKFVHRDCVDVQEA